MYYDYKIPTNKFTTTAAVAAVAAVWIQIKIEKKKWKNEIKIVINLKYFVNNIVFFQFLFYFFKKFYIYFPPPLPPPLQFNSFQFHFHFLNEKKSKNKNEKIYNRKPVTLYCLNYILYWADMPTSMYACMYVCFIVSSISKIFICCVYKYSVTRTSM